MNEFGRRFETVFNCDLEELSDTVNLCIAHVENNVDGGQMDLGVITRIKWVLAEMLTNAIKHSGSDECLLTITADENHVCLEKRDQGNPLALLEYKTGKKIKWPLADEILPKELQLYHNGTESLWAKTDDPNGATFFVEELEATQMPDLLYDTSEHFGLLILTKASDHFEYEYQSGTNRFASTFNLQTE